ncbi:signal peptidase I [Nocardia sp. NPDC004722]
MIDPAATTAGATEPTAAPSPRRRRRKSQRKKRPFWQEFPMLVVIALVAVALVVTFIGRPYVIPSQSMEPTLHGCSGCTGDRIYVEKLSFDFGDPEPGEVIVFKGPTASWDRAWTSHRSGNAAVRGIQNAIAFFGLLPPDENDLVKRVIAVGGQTVQCCDAQGRVLVDGKPLDEPYAHYSLPYRPGLAYTGSAGTGREFGPIKVPDGNVWVMGDNRNESADSRAHVEDKYQGTVPLSDIRGKAVFKIWPPGRIGPIHAQKP